MQINAKQIMTNLDNEPIEEQGEAMTLGAVMETALLMARDSADGPEKAKRFKLALNIHSVTEEYPHVELSPEDVVLIRKVIGEVFSPMIVGRAYAMLEG